MKQNQWVAVSVCFLLAVTLWFLVTLNTQSYTTDFTVPIKLTNFPDNLQLYKEFPKNITVYASGKGIDLLYQSFAPQPDTVLVDFERYEDRQFRSTEKSFAMISEKLQLGLKAVGMEPSSISMDYSTKASKMIPVRLDVEFDLPPSYRIPKTGITFTDSVQVVGPMDSVLKVKECKTIHITLPHLVEERTFAIPLDSMGSLHFIPNTIVLKVKPEPYTEKVLQLAVHPTGLPAGTKLRLEVDTVTIKVLVPLETFMEVQSSNIAAEVDYRDIDERSPFVIPRIQHLPLNAELVNFFPQLLRYKIITLE